MMIDENGINDACYADVPASLGALSVGLALMYPPEVAFTGDAEAFAAAKENDSEAGIVLVPAALLKRNPQLVRRQTDGGHRVYHPSFSTARDTVQLIEFDRWVDWSKADRCELVFRRKLRAPFLVAARFGEHERITFDPPRDARGKPVGRYAYVNLDFWSKTDGFRPLLLRAGDGPMRVYLGVSASLRMGTPIVAVSQVRKEDTPQFLG